MTDNISKPILRRETTESKLPVRVHFYQNMEDYDDEDVHNPIEKTGLPSEFVCYDTTVIKFGKLKGKMHSELLKPENANYANWLMNQNKNDKFFYKSTIKYLEKKLRPTSENFDITSTDYLYLIDLENPTSEEMKRIKYFENNLASHFVRINDN